MNENIADPEKRNTVMLKDGKDLVNLFMGKQDENFVEMKQVHTPKKAIVE